MAFFVIFCHILHIFDTFSEICLSGLSIFLHNFIYSHVKSYVFAIFRNSFSFCYILSYFILYFLYLGHICSKFIYFVMLSHIIANFVIFYRAIRILSYIVIFWHILYILIYLLKFVVVILSSFLHHFTYYRASSRFGTFYHILSYIAIFCISCIVCIFQHIFSYSVLFYHVFSYFDLILYIVIYVIFSAFWHILS